MKYINTENLKVLLSELEWNHKYYNGDFHEGVVFAVDELKESIDFLQQEMWKPSEEHFQGLRRAITKAEKGSDAWNSLTDLYEHLKKL